MCIAEKISGLKCVSSEPLVLIRKKPIITTATPMASRMKFIFPNAKFFLSSILYNYSIYHLSLLTHHFSPPYREGPGEGLYILYNSPAVIFRNLFTDTYEQRNVMSSPKTNTAATVMAITSQVITSSTSGS